MDTTNNNAADMDPVVASLQRQNRELRTVISKALQQNRALSLQDLPPSLRADFIMDEKKKNSSKRGHPKEEEKGEVVSNTEEPTSSPPKKQRHPTTQLSTSETETTTQQEETFLSEDWARTVVTPNLQLTGSGLCMTLCDEKNIQAWRTEGGFGSYFGFTLLSLNDNDEYDDDVPNILPPASASVRVRELDGPGRDFGIMSAEKGAKYLLDEYHTTDRTLIICIFPFSTQFIKDGRFNEVEWDDVMDAIDRMKLPGPWSVHRLAQVLTELHELLLDGDFPPSPS